MEKVKFLNLLSDNSTQIDPDIQRNFEWEADVFDNFLHGLIENSQKFMKNKDYYGLLDCFGVLKMFKREISTSLNYYLDEGGHRYVASILIVKALNEIIEKYNLKENADLNYCNVLLTEALKDIEKNFIPHPIDSVEIKEILNFGTTVAHKKNESHLIESFIKVKCFFEKTYIENKEVFFNFCIYFTKYYSFQVEKNEYTSLEVRKTIYNQINSIQQSQNNLHRALTVFSEDAYTLGVENFMEQIKTAKDKVNGWFPQKKKSKTVNNPYLETYLIFQILSKKGKIMCDGKGKPTDNLNILAKNIVIGLSEKERIDFYQTLFNDIDLFCYFLSGSVKLDLPPSNDTSVKSFVFTSFVDILSDKGKPRYYIGSLYFKIAKETLILNGSNVVGVNGKLTSSKVWSLIKILHSFRNYVNATVSRGSDERSCLFPLIKECKNIENDKVLDEYINFFNNKVTTLFNEPQYKKTRFEQYTYSSKYTKFHTLMVCEDDTDIYAYCRNFNMKYNRKKDFDIDHIVMKSNIDVDNEITKRKINSLGNLRVLDGHTNRKENKQIANRLIYKNDYAFPPNMRGKMFSYDNIDERQEWCANKIKKINSFIYNYEFKQ